MIEIFQREFISQVILPNVNEAQIVGFRALVEEIVQCKYPGLRDQRLSKEDSNAYFDKSLIELLGLVLLIDCKDNLTNAVRGRQDYFDENIITEENFDNWVAARHVTGAGIGKDGSEPGEGGDSEKSKSGDSKTAREGSLLTPVLQTLPLIPRIMRDAPSFMPKDSKRIDNWWQNIPNLSIITGTNGSGKTQLLKYILTYTTCEIKERLSKREILHIEATHNFDTSFSEDLLWAYEAGTYLVDVEFKEHAHNLIDSNLEIHAMRSLIWKEVKGHPLVNFLGQEIEQQDKIKQENFRGIHRDIYKPPSQEIPKMFQNKIERELRQQQLKNPLSIILFFTSKNENLYCAKVKEKFLSNNSYLDELYELYQKLNQDYNDKKAAKLKRSQEETGLGEIYDFEKKDCFNRVFSSEKFKEELKTDFNSFNKLVLLHYRSQKDHPLRKLNDLLQSNGFYLEFRLDEKNIFHFLRKGREIDPRGLSSGEKIIVSLFTWQYYNLDIIDSSLDSSVDTRIKLMLVDEPDKHLDPKLCKLFFDIIYEEFVKRQGIQVIMTTHRLDTVMLVPGNGFVDFTQPYSTGLYTIKDGKIENVHKLRAILRMAGNIRELLDYHHKVYTESVGDALFYEGAFRSLQELSDREKERTCSDRRSYDWYIPATLRTELGLPPRLLSNRYQLSFYSVSEKDHLGNRAGSGSCMKVKQAIIRDETAYENLFNAGSSSTIYVSMHWKRTRKLLDKTTLYQSFGILDRDYNTDYQLEKDNLVDKCVIPKMRHSVENFILDPIVMCSILSREEIANTILKIKASYFEKRKDQVITLISVCLSIKLFLELKQYEYLQPFIDIYAKTLMCLMTKRYSYKASKEKDSTEVDKVKAREIYTEMGCYVTRSEDLEEELFYLCGAHSLISIKYPRALLVIKGHDIEDIFFDKSDKRLAKEGNIAHIISNRVFHEGLQYIPLDLAETLLELGMKVRSNARAAIKADDDPHFAGDAEERKRTWTERIQEERARREMFANDIAV